MGRIIGGVIVGYIAMFLVVFCLMSAAWFSLGPSGAFKPNSWDVSTTWIAASIVFGFLAAFLGGWIAVKIGGATAAKALGGLVVVLGVLMAVFTLSMAPAEAGARPEILDMRTAMMKAKTPSWVAFLNPVLGLVGTLLAARGADKATPTPV